ncbi:hypothetical protein [Methylobacterium sp. WL6]|uniref:hypothetical protein n=1 Tax=Methylobacterium sp. WL6 TaxID=2603901 RepID=UPI0011C7FBEB|nr:hypothetical protein [Methylobacterium sp. WL6]TXN71640.1 hypothetical protein FV230_07785 [Methylobacterium sp. WL6]
MIDPWFGATVAAVILLVFCLGLVVPRRPRVVRTTLATGKLDAISLRLDQLEAKRDLRLDQLEAKQDKNDHDVRNIRMAMESVPTKSAMNKVLVEVATLTGKVEGMHDTLSTNGHSLRRIEDFLVKAAIDNIAAAKGSEAHK